MYDRCKLKRFTTVQSDGTAQDDSGKCLLASFGISAEQAAYVFIVSVAIYLFRPDLLKAPPLPSPNPRSAAYSTASYDSVSASTPNTPHSLGRSRATRNYSKQTRYPSSSSGHPVHPHHHQSGLQIHDPHILEARRPTDSTSRREIQSSGFSSISLNFFPGFGLPKLPLKCPDISFSHNSFLFPSHHSGLPSLPPAPPSPSALTAVSIRSLPLDEEGEGIM